jgi:AAHS family 4-hydroxybenzoate transporter-like MFS transporter
MKTPAVTVASIIDEAPVSKLQIAVMVLCGIVAILDGFDTQAVAFVAPVIAGEWGLPPASFGPVFGAGLLGLTVGALVFGPAADRLGRRTVIIWSTVFFGLFSLLTPLADSIGTLAAMRFFTGLGLGGAMPNIIALTSEYSPVRKRATLVTLMFCGFPFGAVLGGLISAPLMERFGWAAVLYLGGVLPLLLAPVLFAALPESLRYLSGKSERRRELESLLSRVAAGAKAEAVLDVAPEQGIAGGEGAFVSRLFKDGRGPGTILLWIIFFSNLLVLYFLINWLPVLLQQGGLPIERAVIGVAALNAGGIAGGIALGGLSDRTSPTRVLQLAYAAAAVLVAALGFVAVNSLGVVMLLIFLTGVFVIGSQFCMNALAAGYYPTAIRSTGVGWALGIGRIGSVIGPVVGGLLIGSGFGTTNIFFAAAIPAAIAAFSVFLLGRRRNPPGTAAAVKVLVP